MNVPTPLHSNSTAPNMEPVPLVVQIGFAGARQLFDASAYPELNHNPELNAQFQAAVTAYLTQRLQQLRQELKLASHHELVGVSSLAKGADACFTRACKTEGIKQRIFLPQARSEFLNAKNQKGEYDFSDQVLTQLDTELIKEHEELFTSNHIIEERVMSTSGERRPRFQDVNLALVDVADFMICLVRAGVEGKAGGTNEAAEFAEHYNKPELHITVSVTQDDSGAYQPSFTEKWNYNAAQPTATPVFSPPMLPAEIAHIPALPKEKAETTTEKTTEATTETKTKADNKLVTQLHERLQTYASDQSKSYQSFFKYAALVIVATHVVATFLALVSGLKLSHESPLLSTFIAAELLFLAGGWLFHFWLHHSKAAAHWALFRLTSEICRSTKNLTTACAPQSLRHLFDLPLPTELQPLLSKLNVVHIAHYHQRDAATWQQRRTVYLKKRLQEDKDDKKTRNNQLPYYQRESNSANWKLLLAQCIFQLGALGAILAVAQELSHAEHFTVFTVASDHSLLLFLMHNAGFFATFLPVLAVAALSLAAAFDLEARKHSYQDMVAFLQQQIDRIGAATSENEFAKLVVETEVRLIGETANWYARRAFTGVA
jgi:hypothetical protein